MQRSVLVRAVLVTVAGVLAAVLWAAGVHAIRAALAPGSPMARPSLGPLAPLREPTAAESAALDLLHKANAADATVGYRGTKYFGSWSGLGSASTLTDVHHVPGQGRWLSAPGEQLRAGIPTEELTGVDDETGLDDPVLAELTRQYTVRTSGPTHTLGRPATVVEVVRADGGVAGRFWLDEASGLLLRREFYTVEGRRLQATGFLDLELGTPGSVPGLPPGGGAIGPGLQGAESRRPLEKEELDAHHRAGWVLPDRLPDGLMLLQVNEMTVASGRAVHAIYSDGLFSLSVFIQHGRLDPRQLEDFAPTQVAGVNVYAASGFHRYLTWANGDTVYTVVTDIPDQTAARVVAFLPHTPPNTGILGRISRGISRVGSWANPFG